MTLRKGCTGKDVVAVQRQLQQLGFLDPDVRGIGTFGPKTKQAVVDFQMAHFVDGIVDPVTQTSLDRAIEAKNALTGSTAVSIPKAPHGLAEIKRVFGDFGYVSAAGGYVEIDEDWAKRNIIRKMLPVVGSQRIHVALVEVNERLFRAISDLGLDRHIDQFGCWCPRHKMHDPKRGLSTHSWAIAWDINWASNPVGRVGNQPAELVAVFEQHGFQWGGRWRNRDDMHFQFATGY